MIELHQLRIPGFTHRRDHEAKQLRTRAEDELRNADLIPDGTYNEITVRFLRNLIDDLCEVLQDASCSDPDSHQEEIHRIVDNYYPWSYEEAIVLVADLRCFETEIDFKDLASWSDLFQAALVPRILDCIQYLIDNYCNQLSRNVGCFDEEIDQPLRKPLRERIADELNDALPERALSIADEVAVFILAMTSEPQAEIALALLKDGRALEEAVKAAQSF